MKWLKPLAKETPPRLLASPSRLEANEAITNTPNSTNPIGASTIGRLHAAKRSVELLVLRTNAIYSLVAFDVEPLSFFYYLYLHWTLPCSAYYRQRPV